MPLTMDEYEYLREEIEQVQGLVRLAEVQAKLADVQVATIRAKRSIQRGGLQCSHSKKSDLCKGSLPCQFAHGPYQTFAT